MRPNHEGMNQDTKLQLAGPNGERQLYLVGAANGRTTEEITAPTTLRSPVGHKAFGTARSTGSRLR